MKSSDKQTKQSRIPLLLAILFFSIYFINVIVGKISLVFFEANLPVSLSPVIEFALLALACVFFVVEILRAEASASADQS